MPKTKRTVGRPPKSERQKKIDLLKRCEERGIETVNRRTGKRLSEETLRMRCTDANAPFFGGVALPKPVKPVKKRRVKRRREPFRRAPSPSLTPKLIRKPSRSDDGDDDEVLLDRQDLIPKEIRIVRRPQQTLIFPRIGLQDPIFFERDGQNVLRRPLSPPRVQGFGKSPRTPDIRLIERELERLKF